MYIPYLSLLIMLLSSMYPIFVCGRLKTTSVVGETNTTYHMNSDARFINDMYALAPIEEEESRNRALPNKAAKREEKHS